MTRRVLGRAALLVTAALTLSGCKRDEPEAPEPAPSAPATPASDPPRPPAPAPAGPARSLVDQLDLVPPDADGYLVIRDLRPLVEQARLLQQIMAGPLREAIPALAALGAGSGEARLAQLDRARELLELGLALVEGVGVQLDAGVVLSFSAAGPSIVFAAESLEQLLALSSLLGGELDLRSSCKAVRAAEGWYVCSPGQPERAKGYAPAGQGEALRERLALHFDVAELDAANLALSLADRDQPLDLLLRTQPDLWELSLPLPLAPADAELLRAAAPSTLDRLVPGTSFAWAWLEPDAAARLLELDALAGLESARLGELWSGELEFSLSDAPPAMQLRLGLRDLAGARAGVEAMTKLLPEGPLRPEGFEELELEFDRAWAELGSGRAPAIGARATGAGAERWASTLGLDPRARLWAGSGHLNLALGQVQDLPKALEQPPPASARAARAELPRSLQRRLEAGEVGFAVYLVLDHWQAPLSARELDALLAGVASGPQVEALATKLGSLFAALAPWSSVALWLSRAPASTPASKPGWLAKLSLVPFASSLDPSEAQAAREVLRAVLAGEPAAPAYRELSERFGRSARASSYRARLGEAPPHHLAMSMTELALLGALALPLARARLAGPQRSEAPAMTQSILAAALRAREQAGDCKSFLGRAGPTPPLALDCAEGPGGRCRADAELPADAPLERGRYPLTSWTEDPLWRAINYEPRAGSGQRAHYSIEVSERAGSCKITVEAQIDAMDSQAPQIHRRRAVVAKDGSTTLTPLEIEDRE